MDDLLVILITILIAVVGVLNQRKKKKDAQQPVSGNAGQPTDFWEMLMQQEEQRPVNQEVQDEEEEYDEVIDTIPEAKPVYQFQAEGEGSSDLAEEKKILQRQQKKQVLIDGEAFSIRKAIIYNEILNRKYT